ncbi:MAG: hypothetical protein PXX73_05585 [Sideroxydans sp.]|nr:hypothetical protein [Sideroxydans sp.]
MGMIFCRGCGKEIHESATACPHCGAPQVSTIGKENEGKPWSTGRMMLYGIFSFLLPLIGVIAGIVGLIKPATRKQGGILLLLALCGVVMYASMSGRGAARHVANELATTEKVAASPAVSAPAPVNWNVSDPDATSNGNIRRAVQQIQSGIRTANAPLADAANVLKKPWEFYGKPLCFSGTVAVVEDQPPGSDIAKALGSREASEVVIETDDGAIVDLFAMQSSGNLQTQARTTLCGLPTGRVEVPNQLGGKFTHLLIVGHIR